MRRKGLKLGFFAINAGKIGKNTRKDRHILREYVIFVE